MEEKTFRSLQASVYAEQVVSRVVSQISPCVLRLPTGAGKSTAIPYAFIQAGYRVMIAEPTVAMCDNVVQSFKTMFPSIRVGKAYARATEIPKDARLIVCTNGYLKSRFLGNITASGVCMSIEFTDILMLDEVHMGMLDTHVIVSLWYHCMLKFSSSARMPRLLLSSATVSDLLVSRRFSRCVELPEENFTTPYLITTIWASRDYKIQDAARYKEMGELLKALHDSKPPSERILLFVPGKNEMTAVMQASGLRDGVDITLVMIRSESTAEERELVFRKSDPLRLVVLATPSADAGLTVPNLVHVIDSLIIKNNQLKSNGDVSLEPEFASKQLSKQRQGRVGRTGPGFYYPMCTQEFFDSGVLPSDYVPEIYRLPLYSVIVELVAHGIPVEETFAIYQLPDLPKNIEDLLRWGFIMRSPESGQLFSSNGGTFMTKCEIRVPQLAGVLYAWVRMGYPVPQGVVLMQLLAGFTGQMLQLPNFEARSGGESRGALDRMKRDFVRKYYSRFQGPSDVQTAIRLWNAMLSETMTGTTISAVRQWCVANAIQWRTVETVIKNIQSTYPRVLEEAQRYEIMDAMQQGNDPGAALLTKKSEDFLNPIVLINEATVMPILRRLMEHIYYDKIATRSGPPDALGRAVYVGRDGITMEPAGSSSFTLQSDPDSATPYPTRIVVIARRQTKGGGKTVIDQFLDVDDHSKIAKISAEELNTKLGIFVNRGARTFAAPVPPRSGRTRSRNSKRRG